MKHRRVRSDIVSQEQARETSLELLDVQRRRVAEHEKGAEQLARTGRYVIETARLYGMPWTDIAHSLGISVWAARRAARKGSR